MHNQVVTVDSLVVVRHCRHIVTILIYLLPQFLISGLTTLQCVHWARTHTHVQRNIRSLSLALFTSQTHVRWLTRRCCGYCSRENICMPSFVSFALSTWNFREEHTSFRIWKNINIYRTSTAARRGIYSSLSIYLTVIACLAYTHAQNFELKQWCD